MRKRDGGGLGVLSQVRNCVDGTPLAVVSIPLIAALAVFPSFRRNAWTAYAILAAVLCYWLLRNVCG